MSDFETISGDKLNALIQNLKQNNILIKISIPKGDYGQLTVITDIREDSDGHSFQIDPPNGLLAALTKHPNHPLIIEFSSKDKLPHRFEAHLKETKDEIWFAFPEQIQRFQLRNNFRIKAPADAHITAIIDDTTVKMYVDNISIGGLFCHCPNTVKEKIVVGHKLKNISLMISYSDKNHMVKIGRAIVRRVEGRKRPKHFGVAFEFLTMKFDEKKRLTQIVYDLQREYLRNRIRDE